MTRVPDLARLRERHSALRALPETIPVPVTEPAQTEPAAKPLAHATVEEVVRALEPAEAALNAAAERMHALRTLLRLARQAGATGTDQPLRILSEEVR